MRDFDLRVDNNILEKCFKNYTWKFKAPLKYGEKFFENNLFQKLDKKNLYLKKRKMSLKKQNARKRKKLKSKKGKKLKSKKKGKMTWWMLIGWKWFTYFFIAIPALGPERTASFNIFFPWGTPNINRIKTSTKSKHRSYQIKLAQRSS